MKTQIKAEIVADSINQQGERLTSLLITFPRIILAEINTHRMLSKNTSSSRAIPFNKMVESVENDPFIPIAWQKHHSGMQGNDYHTCEDHIDYLRNDWVEASKDAIHMAKRLYKADTTKQLCNRLLEPFMWTTMLITGSKEGWDNFFNLRCPQYEYYDMLTGNQQFFKSKKDWLQYYSNKPLPKAKHISKIPENDVEWLQINKGQAEIHIMDLAEKIYDAMNESNPKQLKSGEWHIPFEYTIDLSHSSFDKFKYEERGLTENEMNLLKVKVSTAMAARTSYTVVGEEKEIDYQKMIELHDRLIEMRHDSPLEHCARAMDDSEYQTYIKGKLTELNPDRDFNENIEIEEPLHEEKGWCRNFKGFIQYRHLIENKNILS